MTTLRTPAGPLGGGLLLVLLLVGPALATTHQVGPGDRIGDALALAAAGDTVVIACGTFEENGLLVPDGVVLRSEDGDPACVTIVTTGGEPILSCAAPGTQTRIEGLTLTVAASGWTTPVARGAGVLCAGSSPAISHCRFLDLEADYGGAVYCGAGAAPTIFACEFSGNEARAVGGALNCVGAAHPLVVRCLFARNSSAVHAAGASQPRLESCTLVDNGGAVTGWDRGAPVIASSIVAIGGAPWFGGRTSVPQFSCTDIWGNSEDWTGWLASQADVAGNLAENPVFCGGGAPDTPWGLDDASPCAPGATPGCGLIGAFDVVCSGTVGIDDPPPDSTPVLPAVTRLRGNAPNPFNPSTVIAFDLRRPGPVEVAVYDLAGRLVARLLAEALQAGEHTVRWDGLDRHGRPAAAGVYLVLLKTDFTVDSQRIALVK